METIQITFTREQLDLILRILQDNIVGLINNPTCTTKDLQELDLVYSMLNK